MTYPFYSHPNLSYGTQLYIAKSSGTGRTPCIRIPNLSYGTLLYRAKSSGTGHTPCVRIPNLVMVFNYTEQRVGEEDILLVFAYQP